jgi:uncharacterized Zn-binding protein involved in type VI secretion
MSDKLKLADGHGDAEIEKISEAKEMDELNRRVRELEQNVTRLKALQLERERAAREAAAPKAAGSNKIGARKHAGFKAISTAPSINKTPIGPSMVPLPYPTVQDLSNSASPARSVRFNGAPAYLLDGTTQPKCTGDEPGTGKGIRSGTVSGEVKPVKGSSTVRIEGKQVVREGDACTMNGGNNPGIYVTTTAPSSASPKDAIKTSNPLITLTTPEEKSAFGKWLAQSENDIRQAAKHPIEGVKGAAKGIVNMVPGTMELLLKAAAEQRATELDDSTMTLTMFGQTGAATALSEAASGTRKNADSTNLPNLAMSNQAQEGGDTISTIVQLFAGGVGILKGGAKWLGGLGKAGKAARTAEVASDVGKIDKAAGAAAGPAGDGVKIAGATSSRPISFTNLVPGESFSIDPVPYLSLEQALRTPGKILYVVKEDGSLIIARTNSDNLFGHFDLANGKNILAGGEGRIYSGQVKSLDNASGHYLPEGKSARDAAVNAFREAGFKVPEAAYVEKVYDFKLGKWVPKNE